MQHVLVQHAQAGAGVDAELLAQLPPDLVVRQHCLGLPARAAHRQHQQLVHGLAQRLAGGEDLKLVDDLGVPPEVELGTEQVLQHGQPALPHASALGFHVLAGQPRQRRAVAQRDRRAEVPHGIVRPRLVERYGGTVHELLELAHVGGGRRQIEAVAVAVVHEQVLVVTEGTAQAVNVGTHRGDRGRGDLGTPQRSGELLRRLRLPVAQQQHGQHRALLRRPELEFLPVTPTADRAQQSEIEHGAYRNRAWLGRRSAMARTPSSCIVRTISLRRMSTVRCTPRSPPAISPYR